jgi:aspartate/methionine/tyrosine aminotransferase
MTYAAVRRKGPKSPRFQKTKPWAPTRLRARSNLVHPPSPLTRLACQGGWYAVLRVPSSGSDEALAAELLDRYSVLVHPGTFFNFAQDGFLVLSLISLEKNFQEGCHRLTQFFG